jgi:hypothetical protein
MAINPHCSTESQTKIINAPPLCGEAFIIVNSGSLRRLSAIYLKHPSRTVDHNGKSFRRPIIYNSSFWL